MTSVFLMNPFLQQAVLRQDAFRTPEAFKQVRMGVKERVGAFVCGVFLSLGIVFTDIRQAWVEAWRQCLGGKKIQRLSMITCSDKEILSGKKTLQRQRQEVQKKCVSQSATKTSQSDVALEEINPPTHLQQPAIAAPTEEGALDAELQRIVGDFATVDVATDTLEAPWSPRATMSGVDALAAGAFDYAISVTDVDGIDSDGSISCRLSSLDTTAVEASFDELEEPVDLVPEERELWDRFKASYEAQFAALLAKRTQFKWAVSLDETWWNLNADTAAVLLAHRKSVRHNYLCPRHFTSCMKYPAQIKRSEKGMAHRKRTIELHKQMWEVKSLKEAFDAIKGTLRTNFQS